MSEMAKKLFGKARAGGAGDEAHWLSVSDLMAGLMMVFLFISIALMRDALIERDRIQSVAVAYQENQVAIFEALHDEFADDLEAWQATIDRDSLAFEFQSPDVLFGTGRTEVQPLFAELLDDFFPRYVETLLQFRDSIDEVRLEGHTDSIWAGAASELEAYFHNMALSQGRTRSVLNYVFDLSAVAEYRDWLKTHFAAVGFSSSRPVLDESEREDREASRRVTFRVITNAETQIRRIIED